MELSWEQIWGAAITTIVGILVRLIFVFLKEQREKHKSEEERKDQIIRELMNTNKELIGWKESIDKRNEVIEGQLNDITNQIKLITNNDLILMKDRILQSCRYYITQGAMPLATRENLTDMYTCYHNMGGNGTCKLVYEQAMKLPIKDMLLPEQEMLQMEVDEHVKPTRRKKKSNPVEQNKE